MTARNLRVFWIVVLVAAGCLAFGSFAPRWFAQSPGQQPQPSPPSGQSQGQQQPPPPSAPSPDQQPSPSSSGPQPAVGETVLAPKKTQPAAPAPEPEKKVEKINPNEIYTVSTTTNLVNVDVMVLDNDGNPISTLGKKNFRVYDDGVQQTVSNFGVSEAPMTICLLIEFSNTMYWPRLIMAVRYAYDFVRVMGPQDWVAAVSFDLKPQILTDFTQDRSEVIGALDTLRFPGFMEINLYDALSFTLDRMKDIHGRKAIVAICTGRDTFSKITYPDMLKIAKASDTPIYPVSLFEFQTVRSPYGDSITSLQARNALMSLARYSGGQAFFPRFEQELPSDYQQIAQQLRKQYGLGFIPTNPARDGKFHKLKVELVDEQGNPLRIVNQKGKQVKYHLVARDGYYAPKT